MKTFCTLKSIENALDENRVLTVDDECYIARSVPPDFNLCGLVVNGKLFVKGGPLFVLGDLSVNHNVYSTEDIAATGAMRIRGQIISGWDGVVDSYRPGITFRCLEK